MPRDVTLHIDKMGGSVNKSRVEFFKKGVKDYIRIHVDRSNTVERLVRDSDRTEYADYAPKRGRPKLED